MLDNGDGVCLVIDTPDDPRLSTVHRLSETFMEGCFELSKSSPNRLSTLVSLMMNLVYQLDHRHTLSRKTVCNAFALSSIPFDEVLFCFNLFSYYNLFF